MTIEDALNSGNSISGTFVSSKPLDDCQLTFGFTTVDALPFFIAQIKAEEGGKYTLRNTIAFTESELKHFAWFMRRVLQEPNQPRDTEK